MGSPYKTPRTHKHCKGCCQPGGVIPLERFYKTKSTRYGTPQYSSLCKLCYTRSERQKRMKKPVKRNFTPMWNSFYIIPPLPHKDRRGYAVTQPPIACVHVNGPYLGGRFSHGQ